MYAKSIYVVLIFLLLGNICAHPQEKDTKIFIDFRVNSTHIDTGYKTNAESVSELISFLEQIRTDSTINIVNISFCGAASPEGSYEYNTQLAHDRMAALERFVRDRINIPDSIITREDGYISWNYIISMVESSDLTYREEVLSIIREEPELVSYLRGERIDRRVVKLKELDGGKVWKELERKYFASMRNAGVVFITIEREPVPVLIPLDAGTETLPLEVESPSYGMSYADVEKPEHFAMSLRTNMLYDAMLTPNIGLEFHLGKGFTIGANWMYAWWSNDVWHYYWRVYGGDINIRKYFGRASKEKPLQGHHVGIYGQVATYDFVFGGRGVMGGIPGGDISDKMHYGVGIEYGYSLPVSKYFNIDFTIGVGYIGGEYQEYKVIGDCYVWQSTKYRNYWGPTKAEVSLVWLIGRGNANLKKGGAR